MKPEERIQTMSGVSKRLFMALSDLRGALPQVEDALFQMASVIDSTSKHHYPKENSSKNRFSMYLESVMTDVYRIATGGRATLRNVTFGSKDGSFRTFGEIMWRIRCSSYHDPNEVDALVHWAENNKIGVSEDGRFIITEAILQGLLLMLITDEANKNYIDTALFDEDQGLNINGVWYPIATFVGNRELLFDALDLK